MSKNQNKAPKAPKNKAPKGAHNAYVAARVAANRRREREERARIVAGKRRESRRERAERRAALERAEQVFRSEGI